MRVLKKRGIHPRRAARKLFLSDAHANLRLEFALTFINMTEEFWENVVFCDEKTFGYGTINTISPKCWKYYYVSLLNY